MEDVFSEEDSDEDSDEDTLMVTTLDDENVMRRYESFKKFDTLVDHSDHNLLWEMEEQSASHSRGWEEIVKKQWKDLEKSLPGGIYVRGYKGRMDLLRACIVGPQGTPYHDGLFFFDMAFPSKYPEEHPVIEYHSCGLTINLNFMCGYEWLRSCIRTRKYKWEGEELWEPGTSTMLHLLVFLQKLLNEKPFFNSSYYMSYISIIENEISSIMYDECIFVKSLKTMGYIMRNPPQGFEDLVVGHFRERACDILKACKAYKDGLQVGSNVSGAGCKFGTNSITFMNDLDSCFEPLAVAFSKIGAREVADEFCHLVGIPSRIKLGES
uniref:putative ubiquitin-conjugating enzyme E2 38 n=1 Tax=Erigeron canadensis TaxID=72917 RepID=UPI001CB97377|nr:putative ubiquitin-conjugating enzyme E2 38 [Erigeron canadensis]